MKIVLLLAFLVATSGAAAALGGAAPAVAAPAGPAAHGNCGTVVVAGKTWAVVGLGAPCSTAKSLVKRFAPMVRPTAARTTRPLGKASGYTCGQVSQSGKASILCSGVGIVQGVPR